MYNSVECAKLLIQHMSNVDLTDRQGRSALAHASFNGHIEMAKLLLENGANANIHDKQERKPIHWASYVGYIDIVKLLVNHGADVNSLDKELYTPLLVACASGKSEEIISLLIEMGADTSATTVHDSSIFHLACLNGHDQIVKLLLNNYDLKIKTNSKGYHPIHYAAGCKLGAFCLELLVSLDVDVNISSFFDGRTPMHVAAMHGRTSCAQILFSNGSQIDVKDSDGNTPLHLAASYGQTSMIKFLIDCGSNIYM
jgi:ankyrin repeat protein